MLEQLLRIGQLHHVAQVHYADAVGNVLHHAQVVGDEQVGQVLLLLQVLQKVEDLRLDGNVQGGNSLVAHHKLGAHSQRAGDADALTLAAGELVRIAVHEVRSQTGVFHHLQNFFLHALVVLLEVLVSDHALADDLTNRHAGIQGGIGILEDHLQILAELTDFIILQAGKIDAVVAEGFQMLELLVVGVGLAHFIDHSMLRSDLAADAVDLLLDAVDLFLSLGSANLCLFRLGTVLCSEGSVVQIQLRLQQTGVGVFVQRRIGKAFFLVLDIGHGVRHIHDLSGHFDDLFKHAKRCFVPVEAVAGTTAFCAQRRHAFLEVVAGKGGVRIPHRHERCFNGGIHLVHRFAHGGAPCGQTLCAPRGPLAAQLAVFGGVQRGNKTFTVGKSTVFKSFDTVGAEAGIFCLTKMGDAAVIIHPDHIRAGAGKHAVALFAPCKKFGADGAGDAFGNGAVISHHGLKRHLALIFVGEARLVRTKCRPRVDTDAQSAFMGGFGVVFENFALLGDAFQRLVTVVGGLGKNDPDLFRNTFFGGQILGFYGALRAGTPGNFVAFHIDLLFDVLQVGALQDGKAAPVIQTAPALSPTAPCGRYGP